MKIISNNLFVFLAGVLCSVVFFAPPAYADKISELKSQIEDAQRQIKELESYLPTAPGSATELENKTNTQINSLDKQIENLNTTAQSLEDKMKAAATNNSGKANSDETVNKPEATSAKLIQEDQKESAKETPQPHIEQQNTSGLKSRIQNIIQMLFNNISLGFSNFLRIFWRQ